MSVHIGELHSDVVPADGAGAQGEPKGPGSPWAAEERWHELRRRAERLAERVCATRFED
ncbi:hypothetical protein [Nonomuraea zeae]|uniref:hypothetical protein n=1 Tax=Nonomuraea zeae TaxID=1642303 RepID=UPI0014789005|nr:hypothetical protein [Nonomuraea zeae]